MPHRTLSAKQTLARHIGRRLAFIIIYEPSWIAEFMSASAVFFWSAGAFMASNFDVEGWGWAMPAAGLLFGPARCVLLFRLWAMPRVIGACMGFVWWCVLSAGMHRIYGWTPSIGVFAAIAFGDLLTVAKFSLTVLLARHRARPTDRGGD